MNDPIGYMDMFMGIMCLSVSSFLGMLIFNALVSNKIFRILFAWMLPHPPLGFMLYLIIVFFLSIIPIYIMFEL
jgi:hypothetical protein